MVMSRGIVQSLVFALAMFLLPWPTVVAAQAIEPDPAPSIPGTAEFARNHPTDWEQRLPPRLKPLVTWQRIVGTHAVLTGWSEELPTPDTPDSRVVIDVAFWDGSDLFALGLPHSCNDKPVAINDVKEARGPLVPIAAEGEPASAPRLPTVHQGDTAVKLPVGLPMAGENPAPSVAPQPLIPALLLLGAGLA